MESAHGKKATSYVVRAEGDDKDEDDEVSDFITDKKAIKVLKGDDTLTGEEEEDEAGEDDEMDINESQHHNSLINPQGDATMQEMANELQQESIPVATIPVTPKKRKKLSLATTEGEVPGEVIEVVGADDELLTGKPTVSREKVIHINKLSQDEVKSMRDGEGTTVEGVKPPGTHVIYYLFVSSIIHTL